MDINLAQLQVTITFESLDLALLQRERVAIPNYWQGHLTPPAIGDVLRFGRWQVAVCSRAWEHDGTRPMLRLYVTPLQELREDTSPT